MLLFKSGSNIAFTELRLKIVKLTDDLSIEDCLKRRVGPNRLLVQNCIANISVRSERKPVPTVATPFDSGVSR